jgi:DNA-binding NtrC family response regulator
MSYKILIVDDEALALTTAKAALESLAEIQIQTATTAAEALRLVRLSPNEYAVVVLDFQMPDKDGAELTREMLAVNPHLIIAINSGDYSRDALKKCFAAGATDFIEKDIAPEKFREKIISFCKKYSDTAETFVLPNTDDENADAIRAIGMIGRSKAMADVAQLVQLAAPKDCTVLIHGESGTGKELVARALHTRSNRRQKPFVAINVGAIPENLLESDLFGHERGSFTGADKAKVGKLKIADGGTVFLDEIGDMKPDLQVKLLRFLQEGEIQPVGANMPIKINVRVVAASHRDLELQVEKGLFREDLFYRLNVVKLFIPPLRARPEDIQPLVAHFQKQFDGNAKTILMKTIRYLERHPWKGNVRELQNEMERLMSIIPSQRIEPIHLSSKFFDNQPILPTDSFDCSYEDLLLQLEDSERKYLVANLKKASSLRDAVKYRMKAPYATVYGRMKKLGILTGGEKNEEPN